MRGFPLPCRLWIFKKGELLRRLSPFGSCGPQRCPIYVNLKTRWNLPTTRAHFVEMRHDQQKPRHGLAEQQASNKLVKLIRKLRWLGLDEEAKRVEGELTLQRVPAADCVVAAPRETD